MTTRKPPPGQPRQGSGADLPLSVVIVEDVADSADTLAALVERLGHKARVAYSGYSAIDIIQEHFPDLVLLDLGLPDVDGLEVARQVRTKWGAKPVMAAVTGFSEFEMREPALSAGCDFFLVKPCERDVLEELLERASNRASGAAPGSSGGAPTSAR